MRWADRTATFEPSSLDACDRRDWAVVVFATCEGGYVLAHIPGRGWTVPSGRIDSGETPEQAAFRECREEIGAEITDLRLIGRFRMWMADGVELTAPTFVARAHRCGELPPDSESVGVRVVRLTEVPAMYYHWDALIEQAFRYADDCARRMAAGASGDSCAD